MSDIDLFTRGLDPVGLLAKYGPQGWWTTRNPYEWTGAGKALARWAEAGVFVSTMRSGDRWWVTIDHMGGRGDRDMEKREQARQRFLGWYVITDNRQDTIPTERVRRDWWLAHQDVGLNVATARRRDGVQALIDAGAWRGRGVLRGVVLADDLWDQAMGVLADAGFSE